METTIQQQQGRIRFNQGRLIDLLEWSTGQYAIYVYERGLQFLKMYLQNDESAIKRLETRIEFWNWWKSLWNARDEVYLNDVDGMQDKLSVIFRNKLYSELHNPRMLVSEICIPELVYGKDFTKIVLTND